MDAVKRRTGIGAHLIQVIEAHAKSHFVTVQLFTDSAEASAFYSSLGYTRVDNQARVSHVKSLRTEQAAD